MANKTMTTPDPDERQAWQELLRPLAGPRWPIRANRRFSAEDVAWLRQGLWPRGLDDRWAVWLEGDMLRCWLAGPRTCVYEARLEFGAEGEARCPVLEVLDSPEEYARAQSDDGELDRFDGVLALVLAARRKAA